MYYRLTRRRPGKREKSIKLTCRGFKRLQAMAASVIIAAAGTGMHASGASAEGLYVPEALSVIEEEAFAGCAGIRSVELPEGVKTIQSRAFADTEIYYISIPESMETIEPDAFEGVTTPMLIRTIPGTEGVRFAMASGVDFEADTTRKALLIGQGGYPYPYDLSGPMKDIETMRGTLAGRFETRIQQDLSKDQILSSIAEAFSGAGEEDISLFYYSGHGRLSDDPEMNGALVGIDNKSYVTAAELRSALDCIPGRKIVIIDACYSGAMIARSAGKSGTENGGQTPAASFVQAFTAARTRGKNLAASPYYVMVSSTGAEKSWENDDGGIFTGAFAESRDQGDTNHDGIVTMLESYSYVRNKVKQTAEASRLEQNVQVYPEGCYRFGLFR